jgi:DNA-binding NtrC family response regulator
LMKVLRYGSKDIRDVEAFDLALRSHIKKLELPNLLGEIYTKCKAPIPQDIRGRISGELPKLIMKAHVYQGDHAGELPTGEEDHELPSQLQELCRLPIREARKKFSKLYLDTVLRKTDNDLKRTAEMTRLTKKGLESIMKRYDIKTYPTK